MWNNLYEFSPAGNESAALRIQHKDRRYRAVTVNDGAAFLAESDNLHLLLKNLSEQA
jgi:hypothetical protein